MNKIESRQLALYHIKESIKYCKHEINQLEKNLKQIEDDIESGKYLQYMENIRNHLKETKATMNKTLFLIATHLLNKEF